MGGSGRPPSPPARAPSAKPPSRASAVGPAIAICKDLFFVARIRETARLANVPLTFTRTPDELRAALSEGTPLVLIDLTGGFDYEAMFSALGEAHPPLLAFTTHALAKQTQQWHARCDRVVTKETLTAELPQLLTNGLAS